MPIADSKMKLITQKIIDLLKVDADLLEPTVVKKYYFGENKGMPMAYPIIYVQFLSRVWTGKADSTRFLYRYNFEVGIFEGHVSEDVAEKAAYDKAEEVEKVLRADNTLGGLVLAHELEAWQIDTLRGRYKNQAITKITVRPVFRQWVDA